ncbi:MAG: GNAT family N-acetyltransferase [Jatrophihabitans sp.]|uniref:GNAT family N-acetyltransferase n=1 Tax=Jatrophihabitans sp. TaxID=1932789 RepID=UPI003F80FF2C
MSEASTPTVTLRGRTDADLDAMYAIASELDTWEERGPEAPGPLTRARYEARLARHAEAENGGDVASFVIEADGEFAGRADLFNSDHLARHCEVGISLAAAARGRGIGTAAMRLLVEFGFVRRNLRRIHLEVIASNAAAIRAYEKAGFVHEGRLREHSWVRGRYEDVVLMGILRSQWTPTG